MYTTATASSNRKSRIWEGMLRTSISYGLSTVLIVGLLALWEFVLHDSMTYVLPRPSTVCIEIWTNRASLLAASRYTVTAAILGFLLGNSIAVLMAISIIYSATAEDTIYPIAVVLRSIPLVAITPFIVMFFGQGIGAKVIIVALTCFFPTLVNMVQGLTSVNEQSLDLMHILNANKWQIFWKMRVPSSLPYLFTSFKITSSAAVMGAIIGEWMGAWHGLGAVIVQAMFNMQGKLLWATMTVATAISILAYIVTALAEPILIPWHDSVKRSQIGEKPGELL